MTRNRRVRYELKTPWRNGTTHVIFEPLDFISRLISLIPKPRVNLARFHTVFAPKSKHRAQVYKKLSLEFGHDLWLFVLSNTDLNFQYKRYGKKNFVELVTRKLIEAAG